MSTPKKGGYCPIKAGNIFNQKYKAVKKLGHGRFSNCWEVLCDDNKSYALKVQKSKKEYTDSAKDEIEIFDSMNTDEEWSPNVVRLLDHFEHESKTGKHICMVLDKMDLNLLDLLEKYKHGMPIPLVKEIAKQTLQGLQFLRNNEVIHTDLKPENILVKVEDSNVTIKIGDLGSGCWTHKHFTNNIGTTEYRSLEGIIDADYDCGTDIWALACIVFELLTDDYLFDPHSYVDEIEIGDMDESGTDDDTDDDESDSDTDEESDTDDDSDDDEEDEYLVDQMHLWLMTNTLGNVPKYVQRRCEVSRDYFHRAGNIRNKPSFLKDTNISKILQREYNFSEEDADAVESFLLPMLEYDVEKRATPEQMLQHPWLK